MKNERGFVGQHSSVVLGRALALIFVILGVLLAGVMSGYWVLVLEPTLRAEAESRGRALAQAQATTLESVFASDESPQSLMAELDTRLDSILLLKESGAEGHPLTKRITLELDPAATGLPPERATLARGMASCSTCLLTEVPIFHPRSRQLIGIASFYGNTQSLDDLIGDVRGTLLLTGGMVLLLIGMAWLGVLRLLHRLSESEANLRSLLDVAPFAIVVIDQDQPVILRANQAATHYLHLELNAAGHLDSPAWRSLLADGLPSTHGEHREAQIQDGDGTTHWAMLSVTSISVSGLPHRLVSLVDVSELKAIQQRLHQAANTDGLTKSYNRRYLFARLSEEMRRADRDGHPLSIILFDLDAFKGINDTFGHAVGDEVLVKAAATMRESVRMAGVCGRYGGEEFLVILPFATRHIAVEIAERIRLAISALTWSHAGLQVTISGGIAEYAEHDIDSLLEVADRKLYGAKQSGRNRVFV
ncbi:MAG: sensor domain-containing diguanylate cyclase [Sphingobacteriia bacterium]|nr:sensor domain-containing diguanylate cyclase [Sphingobacteriia bacterium]NCC39620.1 sensor domain-containing diguanylate cyclase [Gammaproteobacteria bacterium]